jgi:hypothetical protein
MDGKQIVPYEKQERCIDDEIVIVLNNQLNRTRRSDTDLTTTQVASEWGSF